MIAIAAITIAARMMKKLNYAVVQIWNASFGIVFVGILLLMETIKQDRHPYIYEKASTYFWVIAGGMINSIGQNTMIYSMQNSNPNAVALYKYCGVMWGFIWEQPRGMSQVTLLGRFQLFSRGWQKAYCA